jgi:hypothetical protein
MEEVAFVFVDKTHIVDPYFTFFFVFLLKWTPILLHPKCLDNLIGASNSSVEIAVHLLEGIYLI